MTTPLQTRCRDMILGALVADAAALGTHWIYDQEHIRALAPEAPEFLHPQAKNYEGVMGFFAHPDKDIGAGSQYGTQATVMLRALTAENGVYKAATFAEMFRAHFGYGGAYVGYIDHATRDTLDNFTRYEDAARACAAQVPFNGDPKVTKAVVALALPLIARHSGEALEETFNAALRTRYEDPEIVAHGQNLLHALATVPRPTGAHDLQLPAIAKLPPLVAMLATQGHVEGDAFAVPIASAIKITSDHPTAGSFGQASAQMMLGAARTGTVQGALDAAQTGASGEAAELIGQALEMRAQDNAAVTKHFGMACDLPFGVPSAAHNIATATSYRDAVRRNIYGGGDTCGRAMLVGAVMGAVHGIGGDQGIPTDWLDLLMARADVEKQMDALFG